MPHTALRKATEYNYSDGSSNFDLSVGFICSFLSISGKKRTKETPLRERKVSIKQKHGKQRTRMNIGFCLISTSPPPQDPSLSAGVARVKGSIFGTRRSLSGVF
jgi:hypothetical protein